MTSSYLTIPARHETYTDVAEDPRSISYRCKPTVKLTLMRYLQDLQDAETPSSPTTPKYHTGRLPNSKAGDGKPRLLLMGQRR